MRKLLGMAAVAALSIGTAHAAPTIVYVNNPDGSFTGTGGDSEKVTSFSDTFQSFTITGPGYISGSFSGTYTKPSEFITFTAFELVGPSGNIPFTVTTGIPIPFSSTLIELASLGSTLLTPGTYHLFVSGTIAGPKPNASFGGQINFAPVPEPITWGLMIMGFASIGAAMRRRSSAQRLRIAYN